MSHVFISYAHKDTVYLQQVVNWFKENGFEDHQIWYDNIEGGENWRDEISASLDEAYAVVVIVTSHSMKSHYCTYEWSYSLGQGIPIIPLLFEELKINTVHAPLASKQYVDCTDGINAGLLEIVKRYQSTPPQVKIINEQIFDAIDKTHHRYFILTKLGESFFRREYAYDYALRYTIDEFCDGAEKALKLINTLMLERTSAFGGRQYRYCWRLVIILERLLYIGLDYKRADAGYSDCLRLYNYLESQFEEDWLPAYQYFDLTGWWQRTSQKYFKYDLSLESNQPLIFSEILRAFPDLDATDVAMLVDSLKWDYSRNAKDSESDQ